MGKAAGAVAVMFAVGGGAVTVLGTMLGARAEAIALAGIGAGLVAMSQLLGAPAKAVEPSASEAQS